MRRDFGADLPEQRRGRARGARWAGRGGAGRGTEVDLPRRPFCRETAGVRRDAFHGCSQGPRPRAGNGASRLRRPCAAAVLTVCLQRRVSARVCCAHLGRARGRGGRAWAWRSCSLPGRSEAGTRTGAPTPLVPPAPAGRLRPGPSALRAAVSWGLERVSEGSRRGAVSLLGLVCPGR